MSLMSTYSIGRYMLCLNGVKGFPLSPFSMNMFAAVFSGIPSPKTVPIRIIPNTLGVISSKNRTVASCAIFERAYSLARSSTLSGLNPNSSFMVPLSPFSPIVCQDPDRMSPFIFGLPTAA